MVQDLAKTRFYYYSTGPSPVKTLIGVAFAISASVWGLLNTRGLYFLCFALPLWLLIVIGIKAFYRLGAEEPANLELRGNDVLLPRARLTGGYFSVRYQDIADIRLLTGRESAWGRRRFLTGPGSPWDPRRIFVYSRLGNGVVVSSRFEDDAHFDDFAASLAARVTALGSLHAQALISLSALPTSKPTAAGTPKRTPAATSKPTPVVTPQQAAIVAPLLRTIDEQRSKDPFIGAKIAGKEVFARLTKALKGEQGVRAESLFCALGAIAGHACQAAVRAQSIAAGQPPESNFTVIKTKDGGLYYFGDALNALLAENIHSIWSLAAGAAQTTGAKSLPDVNEIFKHNAEVLGTAQFGIPRVPYEQSPGRAPIDFATVFWPQFQPLVEQLAGTPKQWSLAIGFAIQEAIAANQQIVAPELAVKIVMESAIPVSRIPIKE
jgi:hypothetical protein